MLVAWIDWVTVWGEIAEAGPVIVGLLTVLVLLQTNRISKRQVRETQEARAAGYAPMLLAAAGRMASGRNKFVQWTVRNSGTGPALNIKVDVGDGLKPYRWGPLGRDDKMRPIDSPRQSRWPSVATLRIEYSDLQGRRFETVCRFTTETFQHETTLNKLPKSQ